MLRSCGDINQDEFAINAVLLNVGPGDDETTVFRQGRFADRKPK